nr:unnamed protein product [Callosobruchus analis]
MSLSLFLQPMLRSSLDFGSNPGYVQPHRDRP